ncbi:hypothetical protein BD779DRAFT_1514248 [Infundibulicybe gibba]|nr:hypothetical protein BD779DRAFT_1514248 [Infundibulicybe gibba]
MLIELLIKADDLLLILLLPPCALSLLANFTFDDTPENIQGAASISYQDGVWRDSSDCGSCIGDLDPSRIVLGNTSESFSSTVNVSSVNITFTGSGIYVYCAVPHATDGSQGNSDMSFFLDGSLVDTYSGIPPSTITSKFGFQYNVLVYSNSSLQLGSHQLEIKNGLHSNNSIIILDYISYSLDTSVSIPGTGSENISIGNPHPITPPGIAGVAIGVLALSLGGVLFYRRRRQRRLAQLLPSNHTDLLARPSGPGARRPGGKSNPFTTRGPRDSHQDNGSPPLASEPAFVEGLAVASQPRLSLLHSQGPPSYDSQDEPLGELR